jgi:hypothetical protein
VLASVTKKNLNKMPIKLLAKAITIGLVLMKFIYAGGWQDWEHLYL